MAINRIDWFKSPRLIWIDEATDDLTVQVLVNELRDYEDEPAFMGFDKILNAGGKEELGGGVLVGITATLLDAKVAFIPTIAPQEFGTVTTIDVSGTTLIDSTALFIANSVEIGAQLINHSDGSAATVLSIDSETQITCTPLEGGSDNQFDSADSYGTHNIIQKSISGGNLVAVDTLNAEINPVFPTPFNQVVRTAASSATLIGGDTWDVNLVGQHEIEGSSGHLLSMTRYLQKYVYVDPTLIPTGDGSSISPFNNIGDAIDFAEAHSLRDIIALSEITLDRNLKNFNITGIGVPVINCAGYDLKGSVFKHCTMRGTYINAVVVQESLLDNGFYLNGYFENCAINGDLTCVDGSIVLLKDSASNMPGAVNPSISMNGGGSSSLSVAGYSGILNIKDCNNVADALTIEVTGKVVLESTCTAGTITILGIGQLIDNSTGSTVNITNLADTGSALNFIDLLVAKEA